MSASRRRQPSTVSSWPTLSLFAVYAAEPLLDPAEREERLSDAQVEAAKVLFLAAPDEQEPLSMERQGRLMGTVMGVAGFTRTFGTARAADEMAVHSSRRRMVWVEPEPGFFFHATVALPRAHRHSRRASAATTSSAASTAGAAEPAFPGLDDDVLLASLRQGYREYRLRRGSISGLLEREGKASLLRDLEGFWRKWVGKWDIGGGGRVSPLERVLDAVPRSSLLTPHTFSQLYPLLAQFAASHPSTLPLLMHRRTVLSLPVLSHPLVDPNATPTKKSSKPAPPPLTDDDLLALVRLLASLAPSPQALAVHLDLPATPVPPLHPLADSSLSPTSTSEADSGSKWTAPLTSFTDGVSSLFAPRPLPSVSLPSVSLPSLSSLAPKEKPAALRAGFKALRQQQQAELSQRREEPAWPELRQREGSGESVAAAGGTGWNLRNVSWGKLRFGLGGGDAAEGEVRKGATADGSTAQEPSATTGEVEVTPAVDSPSPAPLAGASAPPPVEGHAPDVAAASSQPATPAVELAPAVDAGELAEAMGASPAPVTVELPRVEGAEGTDPPEEKKREADKKDQEQAAEANGKVLELFCGAEDTPFCVRRYGRGPLSLALALLPPTGSPEEITSTTSWLDTRAERLLEAVETVLEVVVPPKPSYPHQNLVKHGLMASSFSPLGDPAASTSDEAEGSATLLESYRALKSSPAILESLTRLSTSQWAVHRRNLDPSSPFSNSAHSSSSPSPPATDPTDVYAVLPAKNAKGKEASLLDAAEELRKVGRAYFA
ncbi:hypothetical protein JCM8097_007112 [Rhodosporidiobolus ruineniae]